MQVHCTSVVEAQGPTEGRVPLPERLTGDCAVAQAYYFGPIYSHNSIVRYKGAERQV